MSYTDLILHADTAAPTLDAAVIGVSAAFFNLDDPSIEFMHCHWPIALANQRRVVDYDLLDAWRTDDVAYPALVAGDIVDLSTALEELSAEYEARSTVCPDPLKVWGADDQDLAILRSCFETCGYSTPWHFFQTLDASTVLRLAGMDSVQGDSPDTYLERRVAALRAAHVLPLNDRKRAA